MSGRSAWVFDVEPRPLEGAPGVAVCGEVDVSTIPRLREVLGTTIRDSEGAFVVDLSELDFLDSSGLSVLLLARAMLGYEGRRLAIVCPPGPVRRMFDVAGVAGLLALYDSRAAAAAALVPRWDA